MKNFSYIVVSVIILFSSCSKNKIVITEDEITNDIFFYNNPIKPFSGICEINYKNMDQVKLRLHFKDGKIHGRITQYYADGNIKLKGEYRDGLLYGGWVAWYPNGEKEYRVNYYSDSLNGEYCEYYKNGTVKEKGEFAMDKKIGNWQYYNKDGKVITDQLVYCN